MARITSEIFNRGDVLSIEFEVMKITEDDENTIVALRPLEAELEEPWLHLPEQQLNDVLAGDVKKAKPAPAGNGQPAAPALDVDLLIDKLGDVIDAKIDARMGADTPEAQGEKVPA